MKSLAHDTYRTYASRILLNALIVLVALASLADRAVGDDDSIQLTGTTMGPIQWNVTIAKAPDSLQTSTAQTSIQSTLDRVDGLMSTYKPESDISRFSRSTSTDWFEVNKETLAVVARALEISELTDGAFDITVAPAVNLWRFGPDKQGSFEIPDAAQIAELKKRVGFRQLTTQQQPPALRKSNPKVSIDLSAIAKGYAVDQVANTLDQLGCENYLVEVGGEVRTRGKRSAGGKWRLGIQEPRELVGQQAKQVAELADQSMATSGDYRNFEVVRGKRYSHTIDPTTCRPVEHSLASASVLADDCMTADAIATAVMVLGAQRGRELCARQGWELLTYSRDSDFGERFTMQKTDSFPVMNNHVSETGLPAEHESPNVEKRNTDSGASESIWPAFIGAVIVISLAILGMAIGAIFGNKPVRGSCGGLASQTNEAGETTCGICTKPITDCPEL